MMGGYGDWAGGMGWGLMGGLWMLLFWIVVIGLVVWGVMRISGSGGPGGARRDDALDIARRRFANGEITKEQFDEIRRTLQS